MKFKFKIGQIITLGFLRLDFSGGRVNLNTSEFEFQEEVN